MDRLIRSVAKGQKLGEAQLAVLERIALRLEGPMQELARAASKGRRLSVDLVTGAKLIPGTPEHLMQRWIDYQFAHLERFRGLTRVVDPKWEKQYWLILKNREAGSAFQHEALGHFGFERNTQLMMPPPGSRAYGFIPDAIKGHSGQLTWGEPYHFVEVKARDVLGRIDNLDAMISYVDKYQGSITLIVRSSKHPHGATRITEELLRKIRNLEQQGKATIKAFP